MKKNWIFALLLILIVCFCAITYTDIPYQGVIKLILILAMSVLLSFVVKRRG